MSWGYLILQPDWSVSKEFKKQIKLILDGAKSIKKQKKVILDSAKSIKKQKKFFYQ